LRGQGRCVWLASTMRLMGNLASVSFPSSRSLCHRHDWSVGAVASKPRRGRVAPGGEMGSRVALRLPENDEPRGWGAPISPRAPPRRKPGSSLRSVGGPRRWRPLRMGAGFRRQGAGGWGALRNWPASVGEKAPHPAFGHLLPRGGEGRWRGRWVGRMGHRVALCPAIRP
jgi:hypothetical protein